MSAIWSEEEGLAKGLAVRLSAQGRRDDVAIIDAVLGRMRALEVAAKAVYDDDGNYHENRERLAAILHQLGR